MAIPEIVMRIAELAEALGVQDIKALPGCWEHQIDEQWWVAVNAHREPMQCSHGPQVPPFSFYFEFNGWPSGLMTPAGGELVGGEAANEDTLIEAIGLATFKARNGGTDYAN